MYNVGVSGKPKRFVLVDGAGTSYGTFEGNIEPTGNYYGEAHSVGMPLSLPPHPQQKGMMLFFTLNHC